MIKAEKAKYESLSSELDEIKNEYTEVINTLVP